MLKDYFREVLTTDRSVDIGAYVRNGKNIGAAKKLASEVAEILDNLMNGKCDVATGCPIKDFERAKDSAAELCRRLGVRV